MSNRGYAGDVDVKQAWEVISSNSGAVLVDCRTQSEWVFVGVPDLSELGKQVVFVEWQKFPAMDKNESFAEELDAQGVSPDQTVLFICRSGQRSKAAAIEMTSLGFRECFNVSGGFEGPSDASKHRGTVDGWKALGLPWIQK